MERRIAAEKRKNPSDYSFKSVRFSVRINGVTTSFPLDRRSVLGALGVSALSAYLPGMNPQAHGLAPQEDGAGEVVLYAYLPDGTFLDFAAFRDRQTNGAGEKWYDDALLESESLIAVKVRLLEEAEGATAKFALPAEGGPYTLTLSWPTSHGYSALMADLPGPGTYDLNELAARTLHDRQVQRIEAGPEPDADIVAARQATEEALARCGALEIGPERGALAAQCLELASEAQLKLDLALASVIPAKAFIGVTFTKVPTPEQINDLKAITGGKRTPAVRLVIGEQLDDLPKWAEVIDGIHALGGIAVIQVRDAVVRRWKSHEDNIARIDKLLKGLPAATGRLAVDVWEVGNDMGGDWLSDDPIDKSSELGDMTVCARKIYSAIATAIPGDDPLKEYTKTLLGLKYQLGQGDEAHSTFTWVRKNLHNGRVFYRALTGVVRIMGLEIAPQKHPLGTAAYRVMTTLAKTVYQKVAISKLAYGADDLDDGPWWFGSPDDPVKARRIVAEHLTSVGMGQARSWGAPLWWNYLDDETPGSQHSGPVSDVLAKVAAKGA